MLRVRFEDGRTVARWRRFYGLEQKPAGLHGSSSCYAKLRDGLEEAAASAGEEVKGFFGDALIEVPDGRSEGEAGTTVVRLSPKEPDPGRRRPHDAAGGRFRMPRHRGLAACHGEALVPSVAGGDRGAASPRLCVVPRRADGSGGDLLDEDPRPAVLRAAPSLSAARLADRRGSRSSRRGRARPDDAPRAPQWLQGGGARPELQAL